MNGLVTDCDGQTPSFNPINYNPEEMEFKTEQKIPEVKPPEAPELPKAPEIPKEAAKTVNCPTPVQEAKEPVGTFIEGYRKKVIEYRLVGKECIQITEEVGLPQQIIAGVPSGGMVMQTGGIAVVATTSALLAKPLADLLLKVIKPTIKKVMKKITTLRGKQVPIESLEERRGQQRIRNKAIRVLKGRG